ncbi:hypothetical protein FOXG_20974 [Fusarium oxysporum f. sp. lycopersici 4287]|uniref:Uncharacterized protein n=1 Tax=Fusarium oxysporum f. sp. lycopersici (strain 4287 / CBS 123668 / FGSC 9935 / NRRL 34936) TaxID=426428 RepID=A0A0J9VST9_FUSO4|nr:hypothetical protein FOXG_20974 [Fusarium oxysporum f. sp. lycopersici 4287]EWZ77707.1 hypothetical protein FOWG_17909 [Fusarium oxysporum f. sp. lycopersici MN25]KNB13923.1 hypothetical protein FOXG_20974 [Fusarium oxysporum f. sp. lycopersici 4287]
MRFSGAQVIGPPQNDRALGIDDGVVKFNREYDRLLGAEAYRYLIPQPGYQLSCASIPTWRHRAIDVDSTWPNVHPYIHSIYKEPPSAYTAGRTLITQTPISASSQRFQRFLWLPAIEVRRAMPASAVRSINSKASCHHPTSPIFYGKTKPTTLSCEIFCLGTRC